MWSCMSDAGKYLSNGASQPAAANSGGHTVPLQLTMSTLESLAANIVTSLSWYVCDTGGDSIQLTFTLFFCSTAAQSLAAASVTLVGLPMMVMVVPPVCAGACAAGGCCTGADGAAQADRSPTPAAET